MLGVVAGAGLATDAKALNPEQYSTTSTISAVSSDLSRFFGRQVRIYYYNFYSNGRLVDYVAPCNGGTVNTADYHGSGGFYCNGGYIFINFAAEDQSIRRFRDGAVAFTMAHEFGHHVAYTLGINWRASAPYNELVATCFAGLYFRWAVTYSKLLNYRDYLEARNLLRVSQTDHEHGTAAQELRAFDFGFSQTDWRACIYGAGHTY